MENLKSQIGRSVIEREMFARRKILLGERLSEGICKKRS